MFRNRTVDAVAGRISRRRGRRCMTTGGGFRARMGNRCCGIGESFWNEASPTPMKREACGVLLARTGECSQARADSPWRVQSVADHAAAVRQGHAVVLAGILGRRPADGVAVLDRDPCARCTGKHIAANAPIFTCRARHHCCPVRGAVTKLLPPRAASRAPQSHRAEFFCNLCREEGCRHSSDGTQLEEDAALSRTLMLLRLFNPAAECTGSWRGRLG